MTSMIRVLRLAPLLLVTGCAASAYCTGEHDYQKATSVPPLQGTTDVRAPQSASALRIPEAPANPVPYGWIEKDEDGDDVARCLDRPPEMVPRAEPAPPTPKPAG